MSQQQRGILVLNAENEVVFAAGLASDETLQAELKRCLASRGNQEQTSMFSLISQGQPYNAAMFPSSSANCFVIFRQDQADPLFEFVSTVDFAADILRYFITNPYEAITVVDDQARVRYMSPVHQRFFGVALESIAGRPVKEVIENTRLDVVLRTGVPEIGHVQKVQGTTRIVNRSPIFDTQGKAVGAIGQIMFKSPAALQMLNSEISRLRMEIGFYERKMPRTQDFPGLDAIIGNSDAIIRLKEQIVKVAALDVPVLLVGESGVGKDLVANAIHAASPRAGKPLVLINAAALPTSLVEAELFGYEGGSFTGAERKGRSGKFEQADQGTLFLDEIGDMPLEIQVKLLRTLQDGTFQRVGGSQEKRSDFRLISASNRDFKEMLATGEFRLDLFYRISSVTLRLPSLRERLDDVPLLAETFLRNFIARHNMPEKQLSPDVVPYLQSLSWPGNVRQLQHAVERAAIFSEAGDIAIKDFDIPLEATDPSFEMSFSQAALQPAAMPGARQQDVRAAKSRVENELIMDAMQKYKGNKKKVAEHLGISRSYLYKKLASIDTGLTDI
ncbi:MAG: sigma 54-interacting transcriptional regulator [Candidimonas sp.]